MERNYSEEGYCHNCEYLDTKCTEDCKSDIVCSARCTLYDIDLMFYDGHLSVCDMTPEEFEHYKKHLYD